MPIPLKLSCLCLHLHPITPPPTPPNCLHQQFCVQLLQHTILTYTVVIPFSPDTILSV